MAGFGTLHTCYTEKGLKITPSITRLLSGLLQGLHGLAERKKAAALCSIAAAAFMMGALSATIVGFCYSCLGVRKL